MVRAKVKKTSKKKDEKKKDEATAPAVQSAAPVDLEDQESMAEAYQEIVTLSAHVDDLESTYEKRKGASLAAKKNFDTADKELREMIRRFQKGDTDPSLFNAGDQGPPTED